MSFERASGHRLYNFLQSALLLGGMAALAAYLGWAIFGPQGIVWALIAGAIALWLGPGVSPTFVLRVTRASEIAPPHAPGLYRLVAMLVQRAGLPRMPRLYYVPSPILNAFATGRGHDAVLAVTDGLLRSLDRRELAGVIAHELAHLRARDLWVMTLADTVGRMTGFLSTVGVLLLLVLVPFSAMRGSELPLLPILVMILAPTVSSLMQLALSRTREYDADMAGAELTGDPRGLASALEKLQLLQGGWMERMFLSRGPRWLRTHPDIHERIRRLLALEAAQPVRVRLPDYAADPFFDRPAVVRRPRWRWPGF